MPGFAGGVTPRRRVDTLQKAGPPLLGWWQRGALPVTPGTKLVTFEDSVSLLRMLCWLEMDQGQSCAPGWPASRGRAVSAWESRSEGHIQVPVCAPPHGTRVRCMSIICVPAWAWTWVTCALCGHLPIHTRVACESVCLRALVCSHLSPARVNPCVCTACTPARRAQACPSVFCVCVCISVCHCTVSALSPALTGGGGSLGTWGRAQPLTQPGGRLQHLPHRRAGSCAETPGPGIGPVLWAVWCCRPDGEVGPFRFRP